MAILFLNLAAAIEAKESGKPEGQLVAQFQLPQLPQIPGLAGPSADWRQWDSFFTFIVKRFGQDVSGDLRDSLGAAFLDTRYELSATVARLSPGENPVPQLFLNGWSRLSPIMNKAVSLLPQQTAERYQNFIGAADKLAAVGQQGAQLGLLQLSPDALRGMARMVQPTGGGDPIAYSLDVDNALRDLLGLGAPIAASPSGTKQSRLRGLPSILDTRAASLFWPGVALAAEPGLKKLNDWVPGSADLKAYLLAVRNFLAALSDKLAAKGKLPDARKPLYQQIVFTAAWQESCWRQFVKRGTPMVSSTGDLGLMQVNRNTWRSLYDLKQLTGDIEYNGNAGGEILLYYLSRFALRKNEDQQPGGHLARATYSAYNGGPGQLARYRAANPNPALKKVDEAFWEKFQAVSSGRELEVQHCFEK
jgi:transglycosylase-like protein with SLT domain